MGEKKTGRWIMVLTTWESIKDERKEWQEVKQSAKLHKPYAKM